MTDDAFQSVFVPILKVLRGSLGDLVVIGGWVPELHRRLGDSGEWAVKPLGTGWPGAFQSGMESRRAKEMPGPGGSFPISLA